MHQSREITPLTSMSCLPGSCLPGSCLPGSCLPGSCLPGALRSLLALVVLALVATLAPLEASAQEPKLDFSEVDEQLVEWPFEVIDYWVRHEGVEVYQHTRVTNGAESIYDYLKEIKTARGNLGRFRVTGVTRSPRTNSYNAVLSDDNVRYFVQILTDGAGAELIVKSTPNAMVTGYFKRAVYDYRLGKGATIAVGRYDNTAE